MKGDIGIYLESTLKIVYGGDRLLAPPHARIATYFGTCAPTVNLRIRLLCPW